jgi:hypothetical protein
MELIERNHCVISGNEDLELLYSFKDFPVFMGCVDHPQEEDLKTDMKWWISKSTGSLQLNPLIPLDVLYANSHGSGSTGELWMQHHREFAEFVRDYDVESALEIGAGHGILSKNYLEMVPDAQWTIVEPNPAIESSNNIRVIREMFDRNFSLDHLVDAIIHSHVIEHLYEPFDLIADISQSLEQGQLHLFSVPRLEIMLKRKYTNCINFEHTVFLTEPFIDYLLSVNGFDLLEKRYFLYDHSIFYACKKVGTAVKIQPIPNEYEKNRRVYEEYVGFHLDLINNLHDKIASHDGKVFMFGGHVFSQYLICFGLDESKIECILDNDTNKQGKRLYGTSLMVQSPKILKDIENAAIILRAGIYNEEIEEDIVNNINPKVIFWK